MRIGEVAVATGVSAKAIRYYEELGVLPVSRRTATGYREYDRAILRRLAFVRAARTIGLTLGEIREVLAFRDRGEAPCAYVVRLIDGHADELAERIAALEQLRGELFRLARRGRRLRPADCSPEAVCHVIG